MRGVLSIEGTLVTHFMDQNVRPHRVLNDVLARRRIAGDDDHLIRRGESETESVGQRAVYDEKGFNFYISILINKTVPDLVGVHTPALAINRLQALQAVIDIAAVCVQDMLGQRGSALWTEDF